MHVSPAIQVLAVKFLNYAPVGMEEHAQTPHVPVPVGSLVNSVRVKTTALKWTVGGVACVRTSLETATVAVATLGSFVRSTLTSVRISAAVGGASVWMESTVCVTVAIWEWPVKVCPAILYMALFYSRCCYCFRSNLALLSSKFGHMGGDWSSVTGGCGRDAGGNSAYCNIREMFQTIH